MRLRFQLGERVEYHSVDHGEVLIGASPTCTFVLRHERIAKHHAKLLERRGQLVLVDLGSRVGTAYDGDSIRAPIALAAGEGFRVGDVEIRAWLESPNETRILGRKIDELEISREIESADEDIRRFRVRTSEDSQVGELACARASNDDPYVVRWREKIRRASTGHSRFLPPVSRHGVIGDRAYMIEAVPRGVRLDRVLSATTNGTLQIPIEAVIAILAQVAEATADMHAAWGPHGAIESRLISLGEEGSVSLLRPSPHPAGYDDPRRRPFLAPERRYGAAATRASDAWSMGCLTRALLGRGASAIDPSEFAPLLAEVEAEDPGARPQDLTAVAARLRALGHAAGRDPSAAHVGRVVKLLSEVEKPVATLGSGLLQS